MLAQLNVQSARHLLSLSIGSVFEFVTEPQSVDSFEVFLARLFMLGLFDKHVAVLLQ